jgi:hypothetical protein
VVGVAVRVERIEKLELELANQRRIACMLFEDRVDEYRPLRLLVGEQIAVGARDLVEELSKNQWGCFTTRR